jgi:PIN domain nuclease of toxin-antitoxin system
MRLLLDSHVFVWAKAASPKLTAAARTAIADPQNETFLSIASAWELWIKHAKKPIAPILGGGAPAIALAAQQSGIALLSIALEHAAIAARLPGAHGDPFDRMLAAQAMHETLTLVTHDDVFDRYPGLRTLKT